MKASKNDGIQTLSKGEIMGNYNTRKVDLRTRKKVIVVHVQTGRILTGAGREVRRKERKRDKEEEAIE